MDTKRSCIRRIYLLAILSGILILFSGCYEGHTGADGAMLLQYLEPEALKNLVENPREDIWIIDVRPEGSYKKGHIPTSKNFPSGEIMDRLDEIPKTQYLILACETGGRAQAVANKLEKKGYTRFMNWGATSRYTDIYGVVK
ncbi:MAG: rhodanese-like domain-containing protein [Deltaproteobacteria bacterium]|nr:rhodanese-like domain-containing protein [Deltaproteobacteria bacterium]